MFDETRLERLIDAYFDQQLRAEEKRELEAMLLGSSRVREIFLERAEWHGLTREWALRENGPRLLDDPPQPKRSGRFSIPRQFWLGAGLAACLALVWGLLPFRGDPPKGTAGAVDTTRDEVALLGQAIGVVWEPDSASFSVGSALPKGWLTIREGTLRLDFYSGARVFLQGPASLELISQDLARLERGRLTASVPPPAEGFTVLSDKLRVIDRGTEFGMSVSSPGNYEVHVFDGKVELQGDLPDTAARSLHQGDAVAIRDGRATAFAADRGSFTDPDILVRAAARDAEARRQAWRRSVETFRATPDLLVHFDFEGIESGASLVANRAPAADPDSFGTAIGGERLTGRWAGKAAFGFARTSDRIRFRAPGVTTSSLTLMAWVRVDSLPLDHNALLSMAPDQVGEIHWKLDRSGKLLLGLRAVPAFAFASWERLESPRIVTELDFGRWMHLATTIDGEAGVMKHFVNGEEVASSAIARPTPIRLGMANLGNFDAAIPTRDEVGAVRNFNGRIDEFALLARALNVDEIRAAAGY